MVVVPAGCAVRVPLGSLGDSLSVAELLVATADGSRTVLLGGTDRDFPDVEAEYGVDVTTTDDGVSIVLSARSLLRDTLVAVELVDPGAHSDVNLVTLLPGESALWSVMTDSPEKFTPESVRNIVRTARAASVRDANFRGLSALESS
jgi:hypothetical protein